MNKGGKYIIDIKELIIETLDLEVKPNKENINDENYIGSFVDEKHNMTIDVYILSYLKKDDKKTIVRFRMFNDDISCEMAYKIRQIQYKYLSEHLDLLENNKEKLLYQVLSNEIIVQILNVDLVDQLNIIKSSIIGGKCSIREEKNYCKCEKCQYENSFPTFIQLKNKKNTFVKILFQELSEKLNS